MLLFKKLLSAGKKFTDKNRFVFFSIAVHIALLIVFSSAVVTHRTPVHEVAPVSKPVIQAYTVINFPTPAVVKEEPPAREDETLVEENILEQPAPTELAETPAEPVTKEPVIEGTIVETAIPSEVEESTNNETEELQEIEDVVETSENSVPDNNQTVTNTTNSNATLSASEILSKFRSRSVNNDNVSLNWQNAQRALDKRRSASLFRKQKNGASAQLTEEFSPKIRGLKVLSKANDGEQVVQHGNGCFRITTNLNNEKAWVPTTCPYTDPFNGAYEKSMKKFGIGKNVNKNVNR